jgi:hypothetical protein
MILVIASELDTVAYEAVLHWPGGQAALVTPADLSTRGWTVQPNRMRDAVLVAGGVQVPATSVSGIVNLLPCIAEQELFDVEPEARRYVAAEATAFLLFLLTVMQCKVVNRPTAECLTGPHWRPEQWSKACVSIGLPTKPVGRDSKSPTTISSAAPPLHPIAVLGGRCVGESSVPHLVSVQRLAALANVCFFKTNFIEENGEYIFHSAELTPDLSQETIRAALCDHFSTS